MKKSDLETLKKMLNGTDSSACLANLLLVTYEVLNESFDDNDKLFVVKKNEKVGVELLTAAFGRIPMFQFEIHNGQINADDRFIIGKFLANKLEKYLNKKS